MIPRTFTVRSRVRVGSSREGKWISEWSLIAYNERGVRKALANAGATDAEVRRWSVELDGVEHCYADIGGNEERAEQVAELERLGIKGVML